MENQKERSRIAIHGGGSDMQNSMKPLTDLRASPRHSAFSLSLAPSLPPPLSPPPQQPQLEPFSAGSYRVRERKTQRVSSPQVSSILYRGRLFGRGCQQSRTVESQGCKRSRGKRKRNIGRGKMEQGGGSIL